MVPNPSPLPDGKRPAPSSPGNAPNSGGAKKRKRGGNKKKRAAAVAAATAGGGDAAAPVTEPQTTAVQPARASAIGCIDAAPSATAPAPTLEPRADPKKVVVANFHNQTTKGRIKGFFAAVGKVKKVHMPPGVRGRERFCFVSFASAEAATQAVATMNEAKLDGRKLCVKFAMPMIESEKEALESEVLSLRRKVESLETELAHATSVPVINAETGAVTREPKRSRDDDAAAPPVVGNELLTQHAQATSERLVAVKQEAADERERADYQGTNAMYLTAQKSELQQLVTEAAAALIKEGKVPTKEVPDDETPFYYMFDSHRDDNMQTLPWKPYAGRAMTPAEGIFLILNQAARRR